MAKSGAKSTFSAGVIILVACVVMVIAIVLASRQSANQRQILPDGSLLMLDCVRVGSQITMFHGSAISKLLGNLIPPNGIHFFKLYLNRPDEHKFSLENKSWLVADFRLTGPNAGSNPLVKPAFFRQFRFVLYGESGFECVQELWPNNQFTYETDGYHGYIVNSRFPRDSRWLGVRVERRESQYLGGPWQRVADLKIRNPGRASIQPWVAEPVPTTKSDDGLQMTLRNVTVKMIPYTTNDIWDHVVSMTTEVRSNGMLLTNWSPSYVQTEDASGNWDFFAIHRSLDPGYVWKLEADFEPESDFSPGSAVTIQLPTASSTITTNVMNLPVTISWDGKWIDASIPTNDPHIALKYVSAADDEGDNAWFASGSWGQYRFNRGEFVSRKGDTIADHFKPTKVSIAVVPNVHATFYTQPQLLVDPVKN